LPLDCRLVVGLLLLSRWKQVDIYKVSRECPVTPSHVLHPFLLALYTNLAADEAKLGVCRARI